MVRYDITPLEADEIKVYINHRLEIAGAARQIDFTDEAIGIISGFSGGTPRLINMICDRSLLAGFVAETHTIDAGIIKRCVTELESYSVSEHR